MADLKDLLGDSFDVSSARKKPQPWQIWKQEDKPDGNLPDNNLSSEVRQSNVSNSTTLSAKSSATLITTLSTNENCAETTSTVQTDESSATLITTLSAKSSVDDFHLMTNKQKTFLRYMVSQIEPGKSSTKRIRLTDVSRVLSFKFATLRSQIRKFERLGYIQRIERKKGTGGYTIFRVHEDLINEINVSSDESSDESSATLSAKSSATSSPSSNLSSPKEPAFDDNAAAKQEKIDSLVEEYMTLNLAPYGVGERIERKHGNFEQVISTRKISWQGLTPSQLRQLAQLGIRPKILERSIKAFLFDLFEEERNANSPTSLFFHLMRKDGCVISNKLNRLEAEEQKKELIAKNELDAWYQTTRQNDPNNKEIEY